jgi:hypothetical protein
MPRKVQGPPQPRIYEYKAQGRQHTGQWEFKVKFRHGIGPTGHLGLNLERIDVPITEQVLRIWYYTLFNDGGFAHGVHICRRDKPPQHKRICNGVYRQNGDELVLILPDNTQKSGLFRSEGAELCFLTSDGTLLSFQRTQ